MHVDYRDGNRIHNLLIKGSIMRFSTFVAMVFAGFSLFSGAAMAQQGELIVSPSYIKPGCGSWELKESGSIGSTPGSIAPTNYKIYALACNGGYIVQKSISFYSNGTHATCAIILLNSTSYTLTTSQCSSFEVRTAAQVNLPIPSTPAYAYTGNVNGCGALQNDGSCTAPQYWVVWPSVANASTYQYQFVGTQAYSGTTSSTSITIPYGYNPTSGQVRACNANNQCSDWRTVTAPPQ